MGLMGELDFKCVNEDSISIYKKNLREDQNFKPEIDTLSRLTSFMNALDNLNWNSRVCSDHSWKIDCPNASSDPCSFPLKLRIISNISNVNETVFLKQLSFHTNFFFKFPAHFKFNIETEKSIVGWDGKHVI